MGKDNLIDLPKSPQGFEDHLTDVLRVGARQLLAEAIEVEVEDFLARYSDRRTDAGKRRVIRNGYLPEREIQTGIGSVKVRMPRVRDTGGGAGGRIRFPSKILPPYLRRTKSLEELILWLYLKGISAGDFSEALAALLGPDAPGISTSTIGRLKDVWKQELLAWQGRDFSQKHYVCTFGLIGFISTCALTRTSNVSWLSSGPMIAAGKSWWACGTATGRASSPGVSFCWTSSGEGW